MTAKTQIIEHLGEKAVLLPSLIADGLAANERIKLRLTLLQEAAAQAQAPSRAPRLFLAERKDAGLDDAALDSLVSGARVLGPGRLLLPGLTALLSGIAADLTAMLAPLQTADVEASRPFAERLSVLLRTMPAGNGDQLDVRDIGAITAARRGERDSIHLLVMDLHKALNSLAAETAVETLDGARVHHIGQKDRAYVKAFMRGLNRTAPLAFGHPGLGTTAARIGPRLTIQNDIGTTDAHVLVIHVEAGAVSIIYTDVHRERSKFFMSLFDGQGVEWSSIAEHEAGGIGDDDFFYLVSGRYTTDDTAKLEDFLEFLGSRIVFIIDWNKARKALQIFVGRKAAIELLTWAAEHDLGHRAFLELGGADLVFEAVRRSASGRIPYGARLDQALGAVECAAFLRGVLQGASQGLAAGRTARLIRDEIQTDLSDRFETAESAVLMVLVRHLGLSRTLSQAIADALATPDSFAHADRRALAMRSKQMEEKADRLTVYAREIAQRVREGGMLRTVIDEVENTADTLDECAFLLGILPDSAAAAMTAAPFTELSEIVTESVGHLVRAAEAASRLPEGQRADAAEALQSIDAVVNAEKQADDVSRNAFGTLTANPCSDARILMLGLEIARTLETATDHLSHSALSLRDRVLEELSA